MTDPRDTAIGAARALIANLERNLRNMLMDTDNGMCDRTRYRIEYLIEDIAATRDRYAMLRKDGE